MLQREIIQQIGTGHTFFFPYSELRIVNLYINFEYGSSEGTKQDNRA